MVCLLAAVGLICGALSITGVALSFSRELVNAVGNNLYLILLAGAFTSFLLGFGNDQHCLLYFLGYSHGSGVYWPWECRRWLLISLFCIGGCCL